MLFINSFGVEKLPNVLNYEDTLKYLQYSKNGDKDARRKLIEHNIRLVLSISAKYYENTKNSVLSYDDIVMSGVEGLIKGVDAYDINKGVLLSTFLITCINNQILMYLRSQKKYEDVVSLDAICSVDKDGNTRKLSELCLTDNTDYSEKFIKNDECEEVRKVLTLLDERDRKIAKMYFGFYDDRCFTQGEIASELDISQSYVSRRINAITKTLRREIKKYNN